MSLWVAPKKNEARNGGTFPGHQAPVPKQPLLGDLGQPFRLPSPLHESLHRLQVEIFQPQPNQWGLIVEHALRSLEKTQQFLARSWATASPRSKIVHAAVGPVRTLVSFGDG